MNKEDKKLRNDILQKHKRLVNTYGITYGEWLQLKIDQDGVCAICKTLPKNEVLCVDHLHIKDYKKLPIEEKKKYVRGLLCFQCNTAFGRIERRKDPRKLLESIVQYFNKYPIKGDIVD